MNRPLPLWVRHIPQTQGYEYCKGMHVHTLMHDYPVSFGQMSVYHIRLDEGTIPHVPHVHDEDEIIVIHAGEMDFNHGEETSRLGPGDLFVLGQGIHHTVRAISPVEFFVLKWLPISAGIHSGKREPLCIIQGEVPPIPDAQAKKMHVNRLPRIRLNAGTALEPVFISMREGQQYKPHTDDYASVFFLLQGPFHGPGFEANAPAVIYFSAGVPHGFVRPCEKASVHLVLEIHNDPG